MILSLIGESLLESVFGCGKGFFGGRLWGRSAAVARIAGVEMEGSVSAALEDVEAKGPERFMLINLDAVAAGALLKIPGADDS